MLLMKETESVEMYFNRTISIANKLRVSGEKLEDQRIIEENSSKYDEEVRACGSSNLKV